MADRPAPRTIAICALIALHSDPTSPLQEITFNLHDQEGLTSFLEESVFGPNAGALASWLQQVRLRLGDEVAEILMETLTMASESVDSLVDLMESVRMTISEGLVDAVSSHGVFLRQMCLGFEELSFESVTLLWQNLKQALFNIANLKINSTTTSWPLSKVQMEQLLRQDCFDLQQGTTDQPFDVVELHVRNMLERDSELPVAYFLRFLNCLRHGERVGALNSLHQYFDHAIVRQASPKDILQFSAILLAITHGTFGDKGLALMATEEAVRVAQQSKDAACVAFALGWLFENNGQGAGERRELLKRCAKRAAQGQLRPLVAGANLSLTKQYIQEDRREPSAAWMSLMEVTAEQVADNLPNRDRPTYMPPVPNQAMESIAKQRLVSAGIWDAFGMPALSELSSLVALKNIRRLSSTDILAGIQNVSRLALYGTPSSVSSSHKLGKKHGSDGGTCVYATAISAVIHLRQVYGVGGGSLDDLVRNNTVLLLHEWAVNRGDLEDAKVLGIVLESSLHPSMANYHQFEVDVLMQKCLLLGRQQKWEHFRRNVSHLLKLCESKGLKAYRARISVVLAAMEIDANPKQFMSTLPPLLEALSISEKFEMHGVHAAALSILAKIFLRLENPNRSLAVLKATIPIIVQREHIWFQAEAYLTVAKCHLQLSKAQREVMRRKRFLAAQAALIKSEGLFEKCQDCFRLREVVYLQSRVYSELDQLSRRDEVSTRFIHLCHHLSSRRGSSQNVLDALVDPADMQRLTERSL